MKLSEAAKASKLEEDTAMPHKKTAKKQHSSKPVKRDAQAPEELPEVLRNTHSPAEPEVVEDALSADTPEPHPDAGDPSCPSCHVADKHTAAGERRESEAFDEAFQGREGVYSDEDDFETLPDHGAEEVRPKHSPKADRL